MSAECYLYRKGWERMNHQHEVKVSQDLLDSEGHIAEPGWARQLLWNYDRNQIKVSSWRIKEWDYYIIVGEHHACAFTVSDMGYMGMASVSMLDFKRKMNFTKSVITPMPMGRFHLPASSKEGNTAFHNKHLSLEFLNEHGTRRILCSFDDIGKGKPFSCDITLKQPDMDTMCIATPWSQKPDHFYLNQKINCMPASGTAKLGHRTYSFDSSSDFGTLDWGRGVWTYDNRWYWASGNQMIDGKPFGFNLGYGFTDRSSASENILFYDGHATKLDGVTFHIHDDGAGLKDYMSPWRFTSNNGCFEGRMEPIMDRSDYTAAGPVITDQHQVFGKLNGTAILEDGKEIQIRDMLMFAEDVRNRY